MARRKTEPQRPDKPGRFLEGYEDDGSSYETVVIPMTDVELRKAADELRSVSAIVTEKQEAISELKLAMREPQARMKQLLEAISKGELEESRAVWKFADDEAGTVTLYDHLTYEPLANRVLTMWERQERMEFEEDGDDSE